MYVDHGGWWRITPRMADASAVAWAINSGNSAEDVRMTLSTEMTTASPNSVHGGRVGCNHSAVCEGFVEFSVS